MAIPRMFNTNTPFIIVTGGSELSFLGKDDSSPDPLVEAIAPHLSHVMQHGTATQVVTEGREEKPSVSVLAQAQREDFQEFSPSSTRCPYSRSLLQKHRFVNKDEVLATDSEDEDLDEVTKLWHHHLQRKQRRKSRTRKRRDGEQPPVIRGLWVQEIDWLKTTSSSFTDSLPCCHGNRLRSCVGSEEAMLCRPSDSSSSSDSESVQTHDSDSSCCGDDDTHMIYNSSSHARWESTSSESMQHHQDGCDGSGVNTSQSDVSDSALDELNGKVTQIQKHFVSTFLRNSIKHILDDLKRKNPTEGLVFHPLLQPIDSQYREGEEYSVLHHIQNGSYGDVFCVRDKSTRFKCAAKRIPLSHFSSEEVRTWSGLNSPGVVELFGVVRDGPNVVLFMDLKPACLAQLLKEMTCLPEDLALHYLHQTLGALEHLHHRQVLHLDVKVDNVLLSADCRDTFLCDFGLSETLDDSGWSTKAFRGAAFPGTETHMAPEVARGDQLCAKADIWSSCCMLLHMLNGCHPWIRYYSHPLCLQIVNEPPPLWEVPSRCNNFTAKVFRAGLQKDPQRRATAKELRRKTTKALRAVGGLSPSSIQIAREKLHHGRSQHEDRHCLSLPETPSASSAPGMLWVSPWRTMAGDEDSHHAQTDEDSDGQSEDEEWDSRPRSLRDEYEAEWETGTESEVDIYMGEEEFIQETWPKAEKDYEGDWEEGDDEEEEEEDSSTAEYLQTLRGCFPLLQKGRRMKDSLWGSETELEYLRDDVPVGTRIRTPSPEPRDDPPSCFSCSDTSPMDMLEKDSDRSSDDLSSGVFSSCRSEGHLEWLASAHRPSSCSFQGVDVWIENVQGECLRIRERRRVKVGHVAVGISDQVSGKGFTLETLDRKHVSFEDEIRESGRWLRCVPAPDGCQRWRWRVRDGKLELRD